MVPDDEGKVRFRADLVKPTRATIRTRPCYPGGEPVAYYFRRYSSLRSALLAYGADHSGGSELCSLRRTVIERLIGFIVRDSDEVMPLLNAKAFISRFNRRGSVKIRSARGGFYRPEVVNSFRREARSIFITLMVLFESESSRREFFERPKGPPFWGWSDPRHLNHSRSEGDAFPSGLEFTLFVWGPDALMNRNVKRAFDRLDGEDQLKLKREIAITRREYRDGPPIGATKGKPKKRRVDNVATKKAVWEEADRIERSERLDRGAVRKAIERRAVTERISPSGIKKRMQRAVTKEVKPN